MTKTMSPQHLAFAKLVADGSTYKDAYLEVYKCREQVAKSAGSQLAKHPKVSHVIATLSEGVIAKAVMDKMEALGHLTDITRDDAEAASARIAAIKTTAELQDWLSPQKVQVMHLHELLAPPDGDDDDVIEVETSWE